MTTQPPSAMSQEVMQVPSELESKPAQTPIQPVSSQSNSLQSIASGQQYTSASQRRSERQRNQTARQEEAKRIKDARAESEAAASRARSAAAKKGAETRRKASLLASAQDSKVSKLTTKDAAKSTAKPAARQRRQIVTLKYANFTQTPEFQFVELYTNTETIWLKLTVREYFFRFDRLCRLLAKHSAIINDFNCFWPDEVYKACMVSLLRLLSMDWTSNNDRVKQCMADIDSADEYSQIYEHVRQFLVDISGSAPLETQQSDEEHGTLLLVRELIFMCLSTETIRVTVAADTEQLKAIEKESQEEIKAIQQKLKDQSQKLLKLKKVDKTVYNDRIEAAQKSARTKTFKAQQTLYLKLHKFNMRTAPIAEDSLGNKFWSLQYKSPALSQWGSWILCELKSDPVSVKKWEQHFSAEIERVTHTRDKLMTEKREARKLKSKPAETEPTNPDSQTDNQTDNQTDTQADSRPDNQADTQADNQADKIDDQPSSANASTNANSNATVKSEKSDKPEPRLRLPKMKIPPMPKPEQGIRLYTVQGKHDIEVLAEWASNQPGVDAKMKQDILDVAKYLAEDDE